MHDWMNHPVNDWMHEQAYKWINAALMNKRMIIERMNVWVSEYTRA